MSAKYHHLAIEHIPITPELVQLSITYITVILALRIKTL